MADTYSLYLQNFRSIRSATVEIAPLTVVYGANGSGKSSLIYGLLTLKNFLTNPGQHLPSFFSYPSISLGGWQEVVHRHRVDTSMTLSIEVFNPENLSSTFSLHLRQSGGAASVSFVSPKDAPNSSFPEILDLEISIPYAANQRVELPFIVNKDAGIGQGEGTFTWNGVAVATTYPTTLANLRVPLGGSAKEPIYRWSWPGRPGLSHYGADFPSLTTACPA